MLYKSESDEEEATDEEDQGYKSLTIEDIIKREHAHEVAAEHFLCVQTPEGQAFGYNTDDQHLLNFMPQLKRLYKQVLADDAPTDEPTFVRWANRAGLRLTSLGKRVVAACQYYARQEEERRNWQGAYADHQFHPVVGVMLGAVMRWWRPICEWGAPTQPLIAGGAEAGPVAAVRELVAHVRQSCRTQAFQNVLKAFNQKAEDNFRSGCDYILAQFEGHSRLLILRIDLYFRPGAKGYGEAADDAIVHFLLRRRMRRLLGGYFGFIIKRENGISRGMHYHVMVILDGNLHRSAFHLTKKMGEAWVREVRSSNGSYFNCYARADRFRYNGLGLVHVTDVNKLLGLRIALWYMSKQDSELVVNDDKVKNFWRAQMPAEPDPRGAPRKSGDDGMQLVKRMLGGKRTLYPAGFNPKSGVLAS